MKDKSNYLANVNYISLFNKIYYKNLFIIEDYEVFKIVSQASIFLYLVLIFSFRNT